MQLPDLYSSLAKAWVFGFIAGMVACYKGIYAKGGPKGVGDAVNQAVVITFILIFFANFVMTSLYFALVPQKFLMAAVTRVTRPVRKTPVALIGDLLEDIGKQLYFYAETIRDIVSVRRVLLRHRSVVFGLVSDVTIGAGALIVGAHGAFVIFSMSFFTGTEVGLQGFKGLEQIGAENFTRLIGAFANTREVTPLIAGVAFRRPGGGRLHRRARCHAHLRGDRRPRGHVGAVEALPRRHPGGCRPHRDHPALPDLAVRGFFATKLVSTQFFGMSSGVYDYYFRLYLPVQDVIYSLAKACLFATVVALIHCYYGYYATVAPAGVGVAVGRAIRLSIVSVVVLNLVLSLIFWGGGNTVSLTG